MENTILNIVLSVVTIILLVLFFFLEYREKRKRKYVNKCPSCKSKNIIHEEPKFIRNVTRCVPEIKNRITLIDNHRLDAMNTKYYTVEEKIFDVKYKCLDCQCVFHQELIR